MPFVHIHNHTEYSLLDGANRIPEMVAKAKEFDMPALAISDHGVMFGVMEFYFECKKQGIKPIIGMEAYVAPNGMHVKTGREENQTYHLLLLAKNLEGYHNLCRLHTYAALEGFYYKPRIDHELLRSHAGGLIGTSACLGSEVCQALLQGDYDLALATARNYKEIFDEGSYFIELQDHGLREQREIEPQLLKIAEELSLPVVATNDAHYLCRADAKPHDVALCIGTGSLVDDKKRLKFETEEFYLKSPEEMKQVLGHNKGAIENSLRIAQMCDLELGSSRALMPQPDVPNGVASHDYLRRLAEEGLERRCKVKQDAAYERLKFELDVIDRTGFDDYFLLVREFADFTRRQGIAFGVRGSAAGSLVSYCIGITDVDPLEYGLTFERFLNPERVSMPDIDMDFEDARRDEVIRWVQDRFGRDRVAQIITFGTLGPKAAIRDSGRVMGYTPQETDRLCKAIPPVVGMTLDRASKEVAEFRELVTRDPRLAQLLKVARSVEGLARHPGVHAAGVVISREPLMDYIPLYRGNDGQPITAFEMDILDKIGLLKMDFLGLSNLTVLARTVENVAATTGEQIDVQKLPDEDRKTFDMLSRGETVGVFQLESAGMRRSIMELKPDSIRELAAMVALYRPGPMDHIPRFVDLKFGRQKLTFPDERMRPILEETYGVIVYQDQVLQLVQALAGFTLGKADVLRRAMGKKDRLVMESMKTEFLEGASANGIHAESANRIWELLLPFAGYAFNKAHAVCYAIIAYQTAYLKAHYPVEYMAALLAVYRNKEERVTAFIEECRRQQIAVLPPDVNCSDVDFTIEQAAVRFGLAAIKGVGEGLAREIMAERQEGAFTHLFEFAERTKSRGLSRSSLEALVKAGALGSIERNRQKLMTCVEGALSFADIAIRNRGAGQDSLFGEATSGVSDAPQYPALPDTAPLDRASILSLEKEVMGIYVSDHPLRGYETVLRKYATHKCAVIPEMEDGVTVQLAGVISGIKTIVTKAKGEKMATIVLEDLSGQARCTAFPATFAKFRSLIEKDKVVTVRGSTVLGRRPGEGTEVRIEEIALIEAQPIVVSEDEHSAGMVVMRIHQATKDQLERLRSLIEETPGEFGITIQFGANGSAMPQQLLRRVDATKEFLGSVKKSVSRCEIELVHSEPDSTAAQPV